MLSLTAARTSGRLELADYWELLRGYGPRIACEERVGRTWRQVTYHELIALASHAKARLEGLGIRPGERVALLGTSGTHYLAAILGVMASGAVVVPLDQKLRHGEVSGLLRHAGARFLICDDGYAPSAQEHSSLTAASLPFSRLFQAAPDPGPFAGAEETVEPSAAARDPDALRLLIYISSDSENPKGVMLSWRNIAYQVLQLGQLFDVADGSFLSVLPFNHTLELNCGILAPLSLGNRIVFAGSLLPSEMAAIVRERRVRHAIVVPAVLGLLKRGIEKRLARSVGNSPTVREQLGEALAGFICGAAALDESIYDFFVDNGVAIYQGYGLTETAPVLTVNSPGRVRRATVGCVLPGTELRRGADGTLYARGPQVTCGYFRQEALTAAVLQDGWLHTGDVGELDADGFLRITGRSKNIIVLNNGKKIHPDEVEGVLRQSPAIADVCLLAVPAPGEERGESPVAIVRPSEHFRNLYGHAADLLRAKVLEALEPMKKLLADYKWPDRLVIADHPFPHAENPSLMRGRLKEMYL